MQVLQASCTLGSALAVREGAEWGTDNAHPEYLGASVPLGREAREIYGLCWLEYMKIRCGPNVILMG